MAELTLWAYRPGNSLLHRLDPRFGLLMLILLSLTALRTGPPGLLVFTIGCIAMIMHLGIGFRHVICDLRYAAVLLLFIVAARGLVTTGEPLLTLFGLTLTREGLLTGGLIAWRLLIIILFGAIFMLSARPSGIRSAIEWYLTPVPLIPQARVGMMLGLLLRFIPVIFRQSSEISDAQRARGVKNVKNPIRRLKLLVIPLLRKVFLTADDLSIAMVARGYCEDRTAPMLRASPADWCALTGCILICAMVVFWPA